MKWSPLWNINITLVESPCRKVYGGHQTLSHKVTRSPWSLGYGHVRFITNIITSCKNDIEPFSSCRNHSGKSRGYHVKSSYHGFLDLESYVYLNSWLQLLWLQWRVGCFPCCLIFKTSYHFFSNVKKPDKLSPLSMAFIFSLNSSKSFTSDLAPRRWKRPPNQPSRKRFSSSSWIDPTCLARWVNVMYPRHFRKKPADFIQFEHWIVSFHVIPNVKKIQASNLKPMILANISQVRRSWNLRTPDSHFSLQMFLTCITRPRWNCWMVHRWQYQQYQHFKWHSIDVGNHISNHIWHHLFYFYWLTAAQWSVPGFRLHRDTSCNGEKAGIVLLDLLPAHNEWKLKDQQHEVPRTTEIFGVKSKDLKISIGTSRYLGMQ